MTHNRETRETPETPNGECGSDTCQPPKSMEHCGLSLDVRWIRSLTLTQQYFEYANSPPRGKTVRWVFLSSVSALNSGGQPWQKLLKIISLFAMVFRVPETQASLVFRARCFGGHPSGQRLKCWGTTGWVQPLHPSQAGIFKFSPDCVLCAGGGFFGRSLSQFFWFFLPWVFPHLPNVQELLSSFWIPFRGYSSVYSSNIWCLWEEMSSEASISHWNPEQAHLTSFTPSVSHNFSYLPT